MNFEVVGISVTESDGTREGTLTLKRGSQVLALAVEVDDAKRMRIGDEVKVRVTKSRDREVAQA